MLMESIVVFWHRRDLRIEDNAGLFYALKENKNVLPLFIFDKNILDKLENKTDARVSFIYQQIQNLQLQYETLGTTLLVEFGKPAEVLSKIIKKYSVKAIYCNNDYEPYAKKRDEDVQELLLNYKIKFKNYKDHVIFDYSEVLKENGTPYTVFTPYAKKWKSLLNDFYLKPYPAEKYLYNLYKTTAQTLFPLSKINFIESKQIFPPKIIHDVVIINYHKNRDYPSLNGTSKLSLHLRFGTISIRKTVYKATLLNDVFLNELIWREFYQTILFHFPHTVNSAFKKIYNNFNWLNNEEHFNAWSTGNTGYAIVDAGMRELNETGFMHNRARMIVASFLTKHLLIDWRWGEAYFAQKLLDYEQASNVGAWQWAAGCGVDAVPYFRVFNPNLQAEKFDSQNAYIKKWIPEWENPLYKKPIVNHKEARDRAIEFYKSYLT